MPVLVSSIYVNKSINFCVCCYFQIWGKLNMLVNFWKCFLIKIKTIKYFFLTFPIFILIFFRSMLLQNKAKYLTNLSKIRCQIGKTRNFHYEIPIKNILVMIIRIFCRIYHFDFVLAAKSALRSHFSNLSIPDSVSLQLIQLQMKNQ